MADTPQDEPKVDSDETTPGNKPNSDEKPTLSETERAAIQRRDKALAEKRELEKRLKELETERASLIKTDAEKRGDVEALRQAMAKDVEAQKLRAEAAEERWKRSQKKTAFMENAHQIFADSAIDDAYTLLESKLDVVDDDGETVVRVVDSTLSLSDYLKQFAEKKPHLAKNRGANGTGPAGSPGDDKKGGYSKQALAEMSPTEYAAAIKKDPSLARKFLT